MLLNIKGILNCRLPQGSTARWIACGLARYPFAFPITLMRSWIASWRLTGRPWPIRVRLHSSSKVAIRRHPSAHVILRGPLVFNEWEGVMERCMLSIGENAKFEVDGEFAIGPGTCISVFKGAQLLVGGKVNESASGITCRSRIMVEQDVRIGKDCIIAWGCFVSDSDWHTIKGRPRCAPVCIGDHVWISHDVSVIKGATIPDGCIVAPKSVVTGKQFQPRSLLAGQPAVVKRNDVRWHR